MPKDQFLKKLCFYNIIIIIGIVLVASQVTKAEVILLDSSTLPVGTVLNENLIVKEDCLQSTATDCLASEKIRSISGMPSKIGQIKFNINLTDNFEINIKFIWKPEVTRAIGLPVAFNNVDWGEQIVLYKSNQKNNPLAIEFEYESPFHSHFHGTLRIVFRGEGMTYRMSHAIDWNNEDINNVKLSVQNGIATLSINESFFVDNSCFSGIPECGKDTFPDSITLNTSEPYTELVIAGIKEIDRLLAVSLQGAGIMEFEAGRQTCIAHPASCGITFSREGTSAVYNPITGEVHIPRVNVLDAFGNSQSSYEVYLLQQPGLFTFDVDMNRLNEVYSHSTF